MTLNWDELNQSEEPAVELLIKLGWTFHPTGQLDIERENKQQVVLLPRLRTAIKKLNPWISHENVEQVVRTITHPQVTNLMEANESLYILLTYGPTVIQDKGDGLGQKSHTVKVIDFENAKNNDLLVTRQFEVQNPKKNTIFPDIVLFVNGLPLGVIECKSPKISEPISEAIKQMTRYQELEDRFENLGAPKLFETVQVVAGICGLQAQYATIGTPKQFWGEWKVPYPLSLDIFQKEVADVTAQNLLLYGMFEPENFLDLVRNFIVFETEGGKTIKKLARYQQFRAVNKAIKRILSNEGQNRGGVVWHTQGSGKSLTMVYMALKLRRQKELENPTLVIVTDRKDLDRQITKTFQNCGFPNPEQASRISHLKELLASHAGKTILSTVQKFAGIRDEVTDASNILVMVDEAHRTQYKSLAARMRLGLKNACFLGFTGTPIDKKDRSTFQAFGSYIDTYTIEEAVKDGATVPIFYESRMAELNITGETIDHIFDRVFKGYTEDEREAIKAKYATEETIAGAPERIKRICLDLTKHFEEHIYPNGYKAQVVAVNRETAVLYKKTLDSLQAPRSALIMSISHNDPKEYRDLAVPKEQIKSVIEDEFKDKDNDLAILIVCDMLLTGFDAPIEQVMYLDSPLREHNLLQAIARVNRKAGETKTYGLVVDYWGVSKNLQEALANFNPEDIKEAMRPKDDELPRLESRHQSVMRFFRGVDRNNMEAVLNVIQSEDIRSEFEQAFKRFGRSLDMVLPDPAGLRYVSDLRWLGDIRKAARNRFRDESLMDLSGCGEKVRQLIEEYVRSGDVQVLLEPISILSPKFEETVQKLGTPEAKASEMEHAIKHEITIKLNDNPVFYKSLKKRLEEIIEAKREERITTAEQLKLFSEVIDDIRSVGNRAESLGMEKLQYAFFKFLEPEEANEEEAKELSGLILDTLKRLKVVDWEHKEDVQREMRREIKRIIRVSRYRDQQDQLVADILDLAKSKLS